MEDFSFKDIKRKIYEQTNEAINYYDNCSYLRRKIEENMRSYNIIKMDPNRKKKKVRPKINENVKYNSIIKFDPEHKKNKGLKPKIKENNNQDKSKEFTQKQSDDELIL